MSTSRRKAVWARRLVVTMFAALLAVAPALASGMQQTPPAQQEFVPVSQLATAEQLPAAPLVIGAYAFVWVALLTYLWSVRRRLDKVQRELADVTRRMSQRERKG